MKTTTLVLNGIKEPDAWHEAATELGLSEKKAAKYFQCGEYADIEIEIDENMKIVGGRVLPLR